VAPPKVSVGIPTYNGEQFIAESIGSVLDQTVQDLQVIVVDDRSTDATVEIVRSLRDPRVVLYENEARLGIPLNWNRAVSLASGEYFCLFHQDDRMQPDNLARKLDVLEADSTIGIVHSAVEILIEPSAPCPPSRWVEASKNDFTVDGYTYLQRLLLEGNLICAPSVLVRREELVKAGGFDPDLGFACDYALWMKLCLNRRAAFLSQPLVQYRWHADNETHRYRFGKGIREMVVAGRRVLAEYRQHPGRAQEAEWLLASVEVVARVRTWAAELEAAKAWLEEQIRNWQREAEQRERALTELRTWAAELEAAKAWLEEQIRNWQREAEQRERALTELRTWAAELEAAKAWLEEQVRNWQREAEQREEVVLEQRRTLESLRHRIATLEQAQARVGHTLGE
jgi:exonuclease VII small subunit